MERIFDRPVSETYRIGGTGNGDYRGTFTLSYPCLDVCQIMGLVGCGVSLLRYRSQLIVHIKSKGCTRVIYYGEKNGVTIKREIFI